MGAKYKLFFVLCLIDQFLQCRSRLSIVSSEPESGTVLLSNSPASLSCTTNSPWFLCVWEGPVGKACSIQEGGASIDCHGEPRMQLVGGSTTCDLQINRISEEDGGKWRCVLSDDQDYVTVMKNIQIEVGVEAQLKWGETVNKNALEVTEDEKVELSCVATGGYPEPTLEWEGPENLQKGRQVFSSSDGKDIRIQTATYTGSLGDHNSKVLCRSLQTSPDGEILFSQEIDLRLMVAPLPVKDSSVAVVVGSVLSVLFVILLCLLLLCFMLRKKKRRKDKMEGKHGNKWNTLKPKWKGSEVGSERGFQNVIKEVEYKQLEAEPTIQRKEEDLFMVTGAVINEEIVKRMSQDLEYLIRSSESTADDDFDEYQSDNDDDDNLEANKSIGEEIEEAIEKIPMETHFVNREVEPKKSFTNYERPKSEFMPMFSQGFMEMFKAYSQTNINLSESNLQKKMDSPLPVSLSHGQHSQPNLTHTNTDAPVGPNSQPDLRRVFHHHHHHHSHSHSQHIQTYGPQGKWKSTNSMFDCELGCFYNQQS